MLLFKYMQVTQRRSSHRALRMVPTTGQLRIVYLKKSVICRAFHIYPITQRNVVKRRKRSINIKDTTVKPYLGHIPPTTPWKQNQKMLTQREIDLINATFLNRTHGLEPSTKIKQLPEIDQEFYQRYKTRYLEPSQEWVHRIGSLQDIKLANIHNYSFDYGMLWNVPLQIGDLVLLKSRPHELSMCVGLPHSVEDPRYTFVTGNGNITFNSRYEIQLRIPFRISEKVDTIVQREPHHGYESIGTIRDNRGATVILPHIVRENVTRPPTSTITKEAWLKLPIVIKKLKMLHRWLQRDEQSYEIPFTYLVQLVENLDLNRYKDPTYSLSSITFDKTNTNVNASTFLATHWGVREQQVFNMWGDIHTNSAILSPVSVTILPIKGRQESYQKLIDRLSKDNYKHIGRFTTLVRDMKFKEAQTDYPDILKLLQDYSAGNVVKNIKGNPIITIISTIFRHLPKYQDRDITRDSCFDLLKEINPEYQHGNPLLHNIHLKTMMAKSKFPFELYQPGAPEYLFPLDSVESRKYTKFTDNRTDYTDLAVYCIDSEVAHEIDDGVSILQRTPNIFTIFVHIADPVSAFPESITGQGISSPLLKLALDKGFTTYLPDMVDPMLPKSVTEFTGMGDSNKKTKAITFSVDVVMAKDSLDLVTNSFKVELSYVSNFPKVTYNIVDQILSDKSYSVDTSVKQDLGQMLKVATGLRNKRIQADHAIIFGEGFNKGLVQVDLDEDKVPVITFKDQVESPSTILVSEFMILANTFTGKYFKENNIPGIYRSYKDLSLGPLAFTSYMKLQQQTKKNHIPNITDIAKIAPLLNSSIYASSPLPHKMIGAKSYLTVTSPLRRIPDLINHIQIHRHLNGLELAFKKVDIESMLWNIQSRSDIIKSLANTVSSYWTLTYLKKEISKNPDKRFKVIVTSYPSDGKLLCVFADMSFARGSLKIPSGMPHPKIGSMINNCKIINIDCLENNLELEMPTPGL